MSKYKLVNINPNQRIETAFGTFIAKDITDEIADKIIERHGPQHYLELASLSKEASKK